MPAYFFRTCPGSQHRREQYREQQRADQSEPVGFRHRRKNLAGDAFHGKKRNQRYDNHQNRKQNWSNSFGGSFRDQIKCGIFGASRLKTPVNIFEDNDRRVKQNAEIDRSDGNQIGGTSGKNHHGKREQQRTRNGKRRDQGNRDVAEENDQN